MPNDEKQRVWPYPQLSMKSSIFHNMKTKFSCLKVLRPPMSSTGQGGWESGNTGKEGVREAGGERTEGG